MDEKREAEAIAMGTRLKGMERKQKEENRQRA